MYGIIILSMKTLDECMTIRYPKRDRPMAKAERKDCPRCHGTGRIVEYGYYKHGKCFECNGTGKE